MKKFDALYRLGQIDEGRLAEALDSEIQDGIAALLKHRKEHGQETTKKSKSTITLKITVGAGAAEDTYAIVSNFKNTRPGRPDTITFAVQEYEKGVPVLIVQSGATSEEDIRQQKLDLPAPPPKSVKKGE